MVGGLGNRGQNVDDSSERVIVSFELKKKRGAEAPFVTGGNMCGPTGLRFVNWVQ
jgi:hypothetical protein